MGGTSKVRCDTNSTGKIQFLFFSSSKDSLGHSHLLRLLCKHACVCECVCQEKTRPERERERKRQTDGKRERERESM